MNDKKNGKLYGEYKKLVDVEKKVIFGSRLGKYKYYDMDQVIAIVIGIIYVMSKGRYHGEL